MRDAVISGLIWSEVTLEVVAAQRRWRHALKLLRLFGVRCGVSCDESTGCGDAQRDELLLDDDGGEHDMVMGLPLPGDLTLWANMPDEVCNRHTLCLRSQSTGPTQSTHSVVLIDIPSSVLFCFRPFDCF